MLTPLDPSLPVADRSLAALARTRALGLHTLGHFGGVTGRSDRPGGSALELTPPTWSANGAATSYAETAMLVDLTLGSAIRSALGPGLRLSTINLTIDHLRPASAGPLSATADADWIEPEELTGLGRVAVVDSSGQKVAVAAGWFVALPAPTDRPLPPVPWEADTITVPALTLAELGDDEREIHDELLAAAARAESRGESVLHALTAPPPDLTGVRRTDDELAYPLPTGPSLGNRVRQVQGGALYGAAASAAAVLAGTEWDVTSGHVQFLRPVSAPQVDVRARTLRRGRRAMFVEVDLGSEGRTALTGRFTLRRSSRDG